MSMITATTWVRRGVAAQFPERYDIDEEEMNRISKLAKTQLMSARADLETAKVKNGHASDDDAMDMEEVEGKEEKKKVKDGEVDELDEYDMEHYDSEPVDEGGEEATMFGNVQSLAYHQPDEEDPYLVVPDAEDADNEREELQVLRTDNLLLAGKVEDEVAHLEVYVYEDDADNLYVHHDVMLPAIPLCVEWLDIPVGRGAEDRSHGNFVAVGTMEPDIEIWDLDVVDGMYPNAILGRSQEDTVDSSPKKQGKKGKKGKKSTTESKTANDEFHVDAILALAANRQHRNLLASASADHTVKLWDLQTTKCAKSYQHHTDKACALDWHPKESTVLLSGSYDRTVVAADMRTPDAALASRWQVDSDVETVRWDPHDTSFFYVTTDSGMVYCYDVRSSSSTGNGKPVWTLQAHDSSVSAFDVNPFVPGYLATGSTDKRIKLWNITDNKPSVVVSRNLDVGKVFSATFGPDKEVGFRLAVAGSKGAVQVWDTSTNAAVRRAFGSRTTADSLTSRGQDGDGAGERMVGVARDDGDSEDEDEDGGDDHGGENGKAQDGWESMDED